MKQILIILSVTFGLTSQAIAVGGKFPLHPDPFKVLTKGKVISESFGNSANQIVVAYEGQLYLCRVFKDKEYYCVQVKPRTNK